MQLEIDLDNTAFELTIEPSMGASYNEFWSHTEINGKCEAKFNLEGLEIFAEMTSRIIAAFRDYPEEVINEIESNTENFNKSWIIWAPIPYSYNTINDLERAAPSPPDHKHWLGTDDTSRDVLARILYGFRLSVFFAIVVTFISSIIGIAAGAIQGFFGGWIDLIFQRLIEVWGATPSLYIIIIVAAILQMIFWILVLWINANRPAFFLIQNICHRRKIRF